MSQTLDATPFPVRLGGDDQDHPIVARLLDVRRQNFNENRRLKRQDSVQRPRDNSRAVMKIALAVHPILFRRYATTRCRVCSDNWDA